MAIRCLSCNALLTTEEAYTGVCPVCGVQLPLDYFAQVAPTGTSSENMPQEPRNQEPSISRRWRKPIVLSLAAITLVSLFVPGGMIWSIARWLDKGHSLCVWNGCFKNAEKTVHYGNLQESSTIGYCNEHFKSAPKSLTSTRRGKSFSGLLSAIFGLGPIALALWCFVLAAKALANEPNALTYFVVVSLAVIFPLNLLVGSQKVGPDVMLVSLA